MSGEADRIDKAAVEAVGGHAEDLSRVDVYLDGGTEPLLSYRPPVRFELDTTALEDGPHTLRVEAFDSHGNKGLRTITFTVRNGPGIAIHGVHDNDVVEGRVPVLVNAYGGAGEALWEPSRAETPAGIPTWAWVLVIVIAAFGLFYGVQQWNEPAVFPGMLRDGGSASTASSATAQTPAGGGSAGGLDSPAAAPAAVAGWSSADQARGAALYGSNCASCHQAEGQGMAGIFPPLVGDHLVVAEDPSGHIDAVLHGLLGVEIDGVAYASPMPSFAHMGDADLALILNHERTSWGNDAPLVTAEDVAARR